MSLFRYFLPKTLFAKILFLLAFLLLLQFAMDNLFAVELLWTSIAETEQHRTWGLAQDVAREIEPILIEDEQGAGIDYIRLRSTVAEFQRYSPSADIYLVNQAGRIVADFSRYQILMRDTINPAPLETFVATSKGTVDNRLTAEDPRSKAKAVFSAAAVRLGKGERGFVYIPIVDSIGNLAYQLFAKSASFKTFVLCQLLGVAALSIAGLVALRGVSRAFQVIMSAVGSYSQGAFDRRVELERNDELGDVASVLNMMAESLDDKIRQLRRKDDLRRELIMDVVHDLHGPTGTMKGFLELLRQRDGQAPAAEREEYYQSFENGLAQLSSLTDQLSQLNALEVGDLKPVVLACDGASLARDTAGFYQKRGEALGIRVAAEVPDSLPPVMCDEAMIRRVLQNLIENALRYTDLDGTVTVRVQRDGQHADFSVEDTGVGISETALPRIFDRTFQEREQEPERKGKSGLGLSIVKRIIEAHGTEIRVTSREGEGTSFAFRLSLASGSEAASS